MNRETHISGQRRSERGFSLIELVVVLSITALLTALLFPGMRAARDSAQRLICASNMRQLGMATITYSMDQRGEHSHPVRRHAAGDAWTRWPCRGTGMPTLATPPATSENRSRGSLEDVLSSMALASWCRRRLLRLSQSACTARATTGRHTFRRTTHASPGTNRLLPAE